MRTEEIAERERLRERTARGWRGARSRQLAGGKGSETCRLKFARESSSSMTCAQTFGTEESPASRRSCIGNRLSLEPTINWLHTLFLGKVTDGWLDLSKISKRMSGNVMIRVEVRRSCFGNTFVVTNYQLVSFSFNRKSDRRLAKFLKISKIPQDGAMKEKAMIWVGLTT